MLDTVVAAISRQMGIQREMDAIANNIANASTDGYKSERMFFVEYLQDIGDNQTVTLKQLSGITRDYTDGPIRATGNPLDIAIRGEGFLEVESSDGIQYTRSGRLHLDPSGMLINADGMPILGDDNLPILTFPGDTSITIDPDGRVSSESGELGRLALVTFVNIGNLEKLGNGLYSSQEDPIPALDATVVQGSLEGSNVESITEMTRMISLLRSYQGSQTLINEEYDLRQKAINILGSVSMSA